VRQMGGVIPEPRKSRFRMLIQILSQQKLLLLLLLRCGVRRCRQGLLRFFHQYGPFFRNREIFI